jgi:mRNA-degrading endonuclease RelE of RelBE toxin-antitoxin system
MKYQVEVEKKVVQFLNKHPELKNKFVACVELILQNPFSPDCDVVKLRNSDSYRLRIGKRRFLYRVNQNKLVVYMYDA